jgi:hypothetical protein
VFASNYLASPNRKRSLTIRLEFRSHARQLTNRETVGGLEPFYGSDHDGWATVRVGIRPAAGLIPIFRFDRRRTNPSELYSASFEQLWKPGLIHKYLMEF